MTIPRMLLAKIAFGATVDVKMSEGDPGWHAEIICPHGVLIAETARDYPDPYEARKVAYEIVRKAKAYMEKDIMVVRHKKLFGSSIEVCEIDGCGKRIESSPGCRHGNPVVLREPDPLPHHPPSEHSGETPDSG